MPRLWPLRPLRPLWPLRGRGTGPGYRRKTDTICRSSLGSGSWGRSLLVRGRHLPHRPGGGELRQIVFVSRSGARRPVGGVSVNGAGGTDHSHPDDSYLPRPTSTRKKRRSSSQSAAVLGHDLGAESNAFVADRDRRRWSADHAIGPRGSTGATGAAGGTGQTGPVGPAGPHLRPRELLRDDDHRHPGTCRGHLLGLLARLGSLNVHARAGKNAAPGASSMTGSH